MKGHNGLPLSDDIIERILIFSPSFSSLLSTILAAKSFCEVYRAHPKSILRAVASNAIGPGLSQALRLLRYCNLKTGDMDGGNVDAEEGAHEMDEETLIMMDEKTLITPEEAHKLLENAKIVSELEDLWSFRYKDRTSRQSKLDPTESWYFRRAMYRIMLYNRIFTIPRRVDEREKMIRKKYLSQFSSDQLLQIHSVSVYLMEILQYVDRDRSPALPQLPVLQDLDLFLDLMKCLALCIGPACVLDCYKEFSFGPVRLFTDGSDQSPETFEGYLTQPISKVLQERNMKLPPEDFTHWHSISNKITGTNDECDKCHESAGFELYRQLSWVERAHGHSFGTRSIDTFLKGQLRGNFSEQDYTLKQVDILNEQCRGQDPPSNWLSTIVNNIFDDNLLRPEFADWTKEDCLCCRCFSKFMREHLWVWVLEYRKKTRKRYGRHIKKNCPYGYNCREQDLNHDKHPREWNHLCEPTREWQGGAPHGSELMWMWQ